MHLKNISSSGNRFVIMVSFLLTHSPSKMKSMLSGVKRVGFEERGLRSCPGWLAAFLGDLDGCSSKPSLGVSSLMKCDTGTCWQGCQEIKGKGEEWTPTALNEVISYTPLLHPVEQALLLSQF